MNTVIQPDDQTATTLLAAVEALGPVWRQRMAEHDTTSTFPFENLAEAREVGLHRLTVPVEYGGFGYWLPGDFSGFYRILERIAYWDTNTAQLLQVHNHFSAKKARSGSTPFDQSAAGA